MSRLLYNRSAGLLLLRIAAGSIFLSHGLQKVGDMSTTITYFDSLGLSPLIAVLIAWLEIIGGVSLILGIAPRMFAGVLAVQMFGATLLMNQIGSTGSTELEFLLAFVMLGIMLLGSGKYALYTMECDRCNGLFCVKKNRVCIMPA